VKGRILLQASGRNQGAWLNVNLKSSESKCNIYLPTCSKAGGTYSSWLIPECVPHPSFPFVFKGFTQCVFPTHRERVRKEKSIDFNDFRILHLQSKKLSSVRRNCLMATKLHHNQNHKKDLFKCPCQVFYSPLETSQWILLSECCVQIIVWALHSNLFFLLHLRGENLLSLWTSSKHTASTGRHFNSVFSG